MSQTSSSLPRTWWTPPALNGTPCLADRIILPGEERIPFCGAEFDIIRTPGHTVDHICVRTPDNVLYLADAMMTGRTLHHAKFPYAFCVRDYLDSMRKLRTLPADKFIVAHFGVYDEILPLVDMEARFFAERMLDLLDLVGDYTTPSCWPRPSAGGTASMPAACGTCRTLRPLPCPTSTTCGAWAIWRPTWRITKSATGGPRPPTSEKRENARRSCPRRGSFGERYRNA